MLARVCSVFFLHVQGCLSVSAVIGRCLIGAMKFAASVR